MVGHGPTPGLIPPAQYSASQPEQVVAGKGWRHQLRVPATAAGHACLPWAICRQSQPIPGEAANGAFSAGKVSVNGCHGQDQDWFKKAFRRVSKKAINFE